MTHPIVSSDSGVEYLKLPAPMTDGGMSLLGALHQRRSARTFAPTPLDTVTLSTLLWAAFGVNRPDTGHGPGHAVDPLRSRPFSLAWRSCHIHQIAQWPVTDDVHQMHGSVGANCRMGQPSSGWHTQDFNGLGRQTRREKQNGKHGQRSSGDVSLSHLFTVSQPVIATITRAAIGPRRSVLARWTPRGPFTRRLILEQRMHFKRSPKHQRPTSIICTVHSGTIQIVFQ